VAICEGGCGQKRNRGGIDKLGHRNLPSVIFEYGGCRFESRISL
jgi:hypothetical protein